MMYADAVCTYRKGVHDGTPVHVFTGPCHRCRRSVTVSIPSEELYAYRWSGKHIQDAMPSVSASDREFLMSGTCPECWDALFKREEER